MQLNPTPRFVRSGFTLIELMLVLAIIAVVAAFVVPRLFDAQEREVLRSAADQLSGAMVEARRQAMVSGQPIFLMYQQDTGVYAVVPEPMDEATSAQFDRATAMLGQVAGSSATGIEEDRLAVFGADQGLLDQLPSGILFLIGQTGVGQENDQQGVQAQATGFPYVAFSPDGTTDDAIIELTNKALDRITVQLRGLTGAVRVGELVPDGLATPSIAPNGVR